MQGYPISQLQRTSSAARDSVVAASVNVAGTANAARPSLRVPEILPALQAAAQRTGVEFSALFNTARLESGLNTNAKARTSSATGLFQFIDSTWLNTLRKYGARHGINPATRHEALALRYDPAVSSLMAAEHMAENGSLIQAKLGRAAGQADLYLAHFLGAGGAIRFLKDMGQMPQALAADIFPAAARANRAIFYSGGSPRTLQQVYDIFAQKLSGGSQLVYGGEGVRSPPHRARQVLDRAPADASVSIRNASIQPIQAARLAYLLLAEMGG